MIILMLVCWGVIIGLVISQITLNNKINELEESEVRRLSRLSKGDEKFKVINEINTNLVLNVCDLERECRELEEISTANVKMNSRLLDLIEGLTESVQNNTDDLDKLLKPKNIKKEVVKKKKVTKKKGVKK